MMHRLRWLCLLLLAPTLALADLEVQGTTPIPAMPITHASAPQFGIIQVDATGEKAACVTRAPKTGTVSKVAFRTMSIATGGTIDVRLETVSTVNGDPTGTLVGTDTNNAGFILNATDDNLWLTATLTAPASVTIGDYVAVVVGWVTGMDASFGGFPDDAGLTTYQDLFTTVWTKSGGGNCALEYDDGSYAQSPGTHAYSAINTVAFSSSTSPDERGLYFSLPYPVSVAGFWAWLDLDQPATITLYGADGAAVLASAALNPAFRAGNGPGIIRGLWSAPVALLAETFYRLTVTPTTTTNLTAYDFDVGSVAVLSAEDSGPNFHHTQRTDAGAWTETTTKRPWLGILVNAFDDGGSYAVGAEPSVDYPVP